MPVATIQDEAVQDPLTDPIRRFNRFYSRIIGGLAHTYLDTPYSLPEARIIHEVATTPGTRAKEIQARLGFDQGHLSRIVTRLERTRILKRTRTDEDGRALQLHLTKKGERFYQDMSRLADEQARDLTQHLDAPARHQLIEAMETIQRLLDDRSTPATIVIRAGRLGDLGVCFHRQAVVYNEDFGYSHVFETYVAKGLPTFLEQHDPVKDRLWVAERNGRPVGWVAIQHHPERSGWAQLRWFLVEKAARGHGIGRALLTEALAFAKHAGYEGILLWTVSDLASARRLYEGAGFRLVEERKEPCPWAEWAHEQRWELRC